MKKNNLARLAAAKNDSTFVKRYEDSVGTLDTAISQALSLSPLHIRNQVDNLTKVANTKLVDMETQGLNLINAGKPQEALTILFSEEYDKQKKIYLQGMNVMFDFIISQVQLDSQLKTLFTILVICSVCIIVPVSLVVGIISFIQRFIVGKFKAYRQKYEDNIESKTQKMKQLILKDIFSDADKLKKFTRNSKILEDTLSELLSNSKVKTSFKEYCEKEWSLENLIIFDEICL